jgi:hypothetical protein
MRIETVAVGRGGGLQGSDERGRVEADGRLSFARGGSVEQLRNTQGGVEQSWLFERCPEGKGDLVVRLRVSGQGYAGETSQGLHFTDARTGLGLRYGHATWIDARGERAEVRARYADGHIEMRVPERVVLAAAYPAVLDPILGPEFGIDEPVFNSKFAEQHQSAVACGPTNCLVVWNDTRGDFSTLRGARVKPDGELIDKTGFTLSPSGGLHGAPAVAFGENGYLVVWSEDSTSYKGLRLRAALVSSEDVTPVLIESTMISDGPDTGSPAVAYDSADKRYLLLINAGPYLYTFRVNVLGGALNGDLGAYIDPSPAMGVVKYATSVPAAQSPSSAVHPCRS